MAVALPLAVLVALAPRTGGDVVAQRWWAGWAATSGGSPVDFGWYAGTPSVSYSLLSPWLMAWLGVTVCGVIGTVSGSAATAVLLARARVPRPAAASVAVAVTLAADQLSGRITFGLGVAPGVLALAMLTAPSGAGWRRPGAALLAAVGGALSPVVAAFVALAACAWLLGGRAPQARARLTDTVWLVLGAGFPLVVMTALGAVQGVTTFSSQQLLATVLSVLLVLAVCGARRPVLAVGCGLTLLSLLTIRLVPDPVGSNVTRLVLVFALPLIVAFAPRRPIGALVATVAGAMVLWLLPPVVPADLISAPDSAHLSGLLAELEQRGPVGRVEVVPLWTHLESQVVAAQVPLARGWLRQVDIPRNPLFYDGTLDADTYRAWLRQRGVSFVALPAARPDWSGRAEVALVRSGLPYLQRVWSDAQWTLYTVTGSSLVQGPATLVSSTDDEVVLQVTAPGRVQVSLFWSRLLTLAGPAGCLRPGTTSGSVEIDARAPGTYVLGSAWRPSGHC